MRAPVAGLLVGTALLACDAANEPTIPDIQGSWTYSETFTDGLHGITCTSSGTYTLVQAGTTFEGSYGQSGRCQTPDGRVDNADSGLVERGRLIGRLVRFAVPPFCEYEGTVTGTPPNRIAGKGVCVLVHAAQTLNFSGTWEASR